MSAPGEREENATGARAPLGAVAAGIAVGCAFLYVAAAALFPWSKPGLQYDEALFVRDAVQILRTPDEPIFAHQSRSWIPLGRRWLPIMDLPYAGPIKGYLMIVPFALFGTGAEVSRAVNVLLAAAGIAGIVWALAREISPGVAAFTGIFLAVHPAILDQTIYDNSIVALWFATLGAVAVAFSRFIREPSTLRAFTLGAAAGVAVWGRMNFLWLLGSIAVSGLIFAPGFRAATKKWRPLVAGFALGCGPLVLFEAITRVGILRFMATAEAQAPWIHRVGARLRVLATTLLSDGEHRHGIWGGPPPPAWQIVFVATLALAGIAIGIVARQGPHESPSDVSWRRASALTVLIFVLVMAGSKLNVTAHHLVTAVPVVVLAAVLGFRRIARSRVSRAAIASLAGVFLSLCVSWDLRSARGIAATGGIGTWSDAIEPLTATLEAEARGRPVRFLSWGLANNAFVLSGGRILPKEAFWISTESLSDQKMPWSEEVLSGGLFVAGATMPSDATEGFRRALEASGRPYRKWTFRQRRGKLYAELYDVPGSAP